MEFKKNPYLAGKNVLDPRCYVQLKVSKDALDAHLSASTKDEMKDVPLGDLPGLSEIQLKKQFRCTKLSYKRYLALLKTRRSGSAPGFNMIPYIVYKKCPQICDTLFNILKRAFREGTIPTQWRAAMQQYIPKVKPPQEDEIDDFRMLGLLNVEGKLFFSLISSEIIQHVVDNNKLINQSIQKGCMPKVPGCWEHMSMVWEALKDARAKKKGIINIWLDIKNAYGSIPHQLIYLALERYGIPKEWIDLVKFYYDGLWSKSFSGTAPSSWHHHKKGIFAGCTLSIILFLCGINIIIEYACLSSAKEYVLSTGVSVPLLRAFMDDMDIMAPSVSAGKDILERCSTTLKWARMESRNDKSRSLVVKGGRCLNSCPFYVGEVSASSRIPSVQRKPVRFLGRIINGSLTDRNSTDELEEKLRDGIKLIDKSAHSGLDKVWILQFLLVPQIRWPLMIYEVPFNRVKILEQFISKHIRKWLRLHHSISDVCLYSDHSPCPLL